VERPRPAHTRPPRSHPPHMPCHQRL